jgi:Mn-dependent DtxR family transcriptional regulator
MKKKLSELELKILTGMYTYAEYKMVFPNVRELADKLGIHYTVVQEYKTKLARKGILFEK